MKTAQRQTLTPQFTPAERRNLVQLAKRFIAVPSDSNRNDELKCVLKCALAELKGFRIELFEKNGVKSALIYTAKKRPTRFTVMLNGHLDVVPGKTEHYRPRIKNGRIYGVGAMDMKSNVAALITAFRRIAPLLTYPLGLQIVTDEELGGFNGTKYQIDQGVQADFVIAGETTNFDIVNEAKGIVWAKVTCSGKTAHGAYPWAGVNAIWRMHDFLQKLQQRYPVPPRATYATTINLSRIETGNQSLNKIPDDCAVWLDIRYRACRRSAVLADLQRLLPKDFKLELLAKEAALITNPKNPFIKRLQGSVKRQIAHNCRLYCAQGSSDARHYAQVGTDGIEFGPVGGGIGTDSEWVDIKSLQQYVEILEDFLASLDKTSGC